ncbi:MAG: site-specific integrase [Thermodesulfobacteriota bacterium]
MSVKVRERPKGSGVWWLFIDHRGQRKSKKIGKDKRLATEAAKKLSAKLVLNDMALGTEEKEPLPLFKDYAQQWLHGYVKPLRKPSTFERYEQAMKHILPIIGNKPLDQITRGDVRDVLLRIFQQGLSNSSVSIARDAISGPFGHAVDAELIQVNPGIGVLKRLGLERRQQLSIEPLTRDEVDLFLTTCQNREPGYYEFFLCAFRTGMRLGELIALHWGDIDFNGKFIVVRRSYRRGKLDTTKTGKERRVDMSDQLETALRNLLTRRKREALSTGKGEPVEIVFHQDGDYLPQNTVRNVFNRILRKAGLRKVRIHDMRHTFASLLLSNGESPVYVKEQLGHSSISITVDIYGHLIPSSNRKAVNRLDSQLSATYPQPSKTEKLQVVDIAANS